MESKDLMIGNYTRDKFGKIFTVKELHHNKKIRRFPITLTEEWLLKFGYKKWKHNNRWSLNKHLMYFKADGLLYYGSGYSRINIKHVHQLQNLYKALTNEDLKIK